MKPAILHVIRRNIHGDVDIVEVTSQKARRYYGRNEHGEPTNCAARDVIAALPTGPQAQTILAKVKELEAVRRNKQREAYKVQRIACDTANAEFDVALKGLLAP